MMNIGGRIHSYYGAAENFQKYPGGSAYSDLLFFIKEAVKMSDEETAAYKHICRLVKEDKNLIKKFLLIVETECEVKRKMAVLEKNRKLELLGLLNLTESKIIAEIVKGTDFNKIPQSIGIADSSFGCVMGGIYKKTAKIISYGQRLKKTALYGYIFGKCGFVRGEKVVILDKTNETSIDFTANKHKNQVNIDIESEKPMNNKSENKINSFDDDFALMRTLNILQKKFNECCIAVGKEAVMGNVQKAIESEGSKKGKGYGNAIEVLTVLRKELRGE